MNNKSNLPIKESNGLFSKLLKFIKKTFAKQNAVEDNSNINALELQQKLEKGLIQEKDLSEEQYIAIKNLYQTQVEEAEEILSIKKWELQTYKNKILDKRNKLAKKQNNNVGVNSDTQKPNEKSFEQLSAEYEKKIKENNLKIEYLKAKIKQKKRSLTGYEF